MNDAINTDGTDPRRTSPVGDLHRLADRNVIVRHHLYAWRGGIFPTFEQCLLSLALELADSNQRLLEGLAKRAKRGRVVTLPDGFHVTTSVFHPDCRWRANFNDGSGIPAPGWYACRTQRESAHVMRCEMHGPFGDEAKCVAWCNEQNTSAADTPTVVGETKV